MIFNAVIGILMSAVLAVFSGGILRMVSIAPALFAGGEALSQLWLFIVAPVFGAALSVKIR